MSGLKDQSTRVVPRNNSVSYFTIRGGFLFVLRLITTLSPLFILDITYIFITGGI